MDNTTAVPASEYEREIEKTIPFHAVLLSQAVDVALAARPSPARWLDTGCGPGRLAEIAGARCAAAFTLADPSPAMLAIARARHAALPPERFLEVPSEGLPDGLPPFDVITAVLCHHYCDEPGRRRAVARCFERLAPGGAFVAFENVRAESEEGQAIARARWADFQRRAGREEETVRAQVAREGTRFFPIRVSEHLRVLEGAGFSVVELIWRSYHQAGFLALKR